MNAKQIDQMINELAKDFENHNHLQVIEKAKSKLGKSFKRTDIMSKPAGGFVKRMAIFTKGRTRIIFNYSDNITSEIVRKSSRNDFWAYVNQY